MRLIFLIVAVVLFSSRGNALCTATGSDGLPGGESCALSEINLAIPALARVSLLRPFSLGEFDYETPPQTSDDFCIWYNTEEFSMTVNSSNSVGDGSFSLLGSNTTERIPYEVTWFDSTAGSGTPLNLSSLENIPQDQLSLPQRPDDSGCAVNNVSIGITVPLQNLEGKPEDSYGDTLTVTVSVQ